MLLPSAILVGLAALATAHPGHEAEELAHAIKNRETVHSGKRALENCAAKLQSRGINDRSVERRSATVNKHRTEKRIDVNSPLVKRNTTEILAKDHEGTLNATTAASDESYVFADNTCVILSPEAVVGPYYVLGEYVRSDITEEEPGVEVVTDIQLIDVSTCEPLGGAWADIWAANSTGVYPGVQVSGNGNANDASNLNNTGLRGIQQADDDGVVQFTTIFPGHYQGRTTHIHIAIHENATELSNGTISGGTVSHVGQFFFDQSLIGIVEATDPYTTNTQDLTTNEEDGILVELTADSTSDPLFNYVYFGEDVTDGLFAWILVGVNTSASYDPSYSFALTSSGGVAESGGSADGGGGFPGGGGGGFPGGEGGGPGNGTAPGNSTGGFPGGDGTGPFGGL